MSKSVTTRQHNRSGKAARQQIVLAAEQILKQDGYHAFSTRRVADACGISVGNLTYHFPNKADLVAAVMSAVCERYKNTRLRDESNPDQNAEQYLRSLVDFLAEDSTKPDTRRLFLELWVMAKHHAFGSEILDQFYRTAQGWIAQSLRRYFPDAPEASLKKTAYFLLAVSEGMVPVFAVSKQTLIAADDISEFAVQGALAILNQTAR